MNSSSYKCANGKTTKQISHCKNSSEIVMVFDATFDNISFISWHSVLLVEETGVPGKNH
jgi:hypothetical protein